MACWFRSLFIPDPYWQRPSAARSPRHPRPDPARLGSPVVQARLAAGLCENASFQDDALRERRKARYSSMSSSAAAGSLAGSAVCVTLQCRFQFARIDVHRPRQMGRPGLYVQAEHSLCSPIGSVGDAVDELFFGFHAVIAGRQHLIQPGKDEGPLESHCLLAGACLRSEEHTSELQSLMRISYAVSCWK